MTRSGWQAEDQIAVEYLEHVKKAVADDDAFANFKSNPKYKTILEHVLKDQGQCYLNICREMSEEGVEQNIELFKENDKYAIQRLSLTLISMVPSLQQLSGI